MKLPLIAVILFLYSTTSIAQYSRDDGRIELITIGAGVGFSSFIGDLNNEGETATLSNLRPFYHLNFERRFGNILGAQIDASMGTFSYNEHSGTLSQNRNFESKFTQFGLNLVLHFDNDLLLKKSTPFAPYFSAGFHYLKFDSYTDLKDKNGINYNYWSDGTIKDVSELDKDAPNALIINRDYNYETLLTDSTTNYERNTFAVPITLGFKWKLSQKLHGRFFGTYNILFSDWVDNIQANGDNDKNFNFGFGIHYVLKMKNKERRHRYDEVDFLAIDNSDSDQDGIKDDIDICQNTPKGVKVNGSGCPLDKDRDGIPDYLDKENDTKKGAIVDEQGRTLTAEIIAERKEAQMAMTTQRNVSFSEAPSATTLDKIFDEIVESKSGSSSIPPHLIEADTNHDGLISPEEVTGAIDGFFAGMNALSVKAINDLIDYFFEQ